MSSHYTYLNFLTENPDQQKLITALLVGGAFVLVAGKAKKSLAVAGGADAVCVPTERASLTSVIDLMVEGLVRYQDSILGKEGRKYLPFTGTIFFFLLVLNLIGLIPGVPAATTSSWVTVGMPLVVFAYFNYLGIKEHGLVKYLKHFAGPVWWLAPFLFVLEVVFTLPLRVVTLNLRLYWNIAADHLVVEKFHELVTWGLPAFLYVLGTFVCFMQAFIFTTLTMVYILLATQHEEGHEEHDH